EMSKRQLRKVKEKIIKNTRNTRIVFDDDGNARPLYELKNEESFREQGDVQTQVAEFQQRNRAHMEQADVQDRELARQKRREKRVAKKIREREEMGLDQGDENMAILESDDGHNYKHAAEMDQDSSDEEPSKRRRVLEVDNSANMTLEDQEQLALRLLGGSN
ncbi:ATP-dependent RNA helicase dbp4, partial [Coemansia sp. RSA 1290]